MLKTAEQALTVTLCYTTKTLFLEKEGVMDSVETIELVKAGQILATLAPTGEESAVPVKPTRLSAENQQLASETLSGMTVRAAPAVP